MPNYGRYGFIGDTSDISGLPDWLREQFQQVSAGSEADSGSLYRLNGGAGSFILPDGRNVTQVHDRNRYGDETVLDQGAVEQNADFGEITDPNNFRQTATTPAEIARAMAIIYGGGMLGGGFLDSLTAGAGAGGAGAGAGYMDAIGNAAEGAWSGSGMTGPLAGPPDSYWNMFADAGGTASDASSGMGLGEYGGLDPETWAGAGGMGVGQNGIGPGSFGDVLSGTINNPSSLFGRGGDVLGRLGPAIARNPLGAMQAGAGLYSMLGGGRGGSGGSGGGDDSVPNGPVPEFNPWSGPFVSNPHNRRRVPFMGLFGG